MEKKMVVITTNNDRRGVFFGELKSFNEEKKICTLKDAQMCIYWSKEIHGVLGLAAIGPQKGSRVSPVVGEIQVDGVTAIIMASDDAIKLWRAEPWS